MKFKEILYVKHNQSKKERKFVFIILYYFAMLINCTLEQNIAKFMMTIIHKLRSILMNIFVL